MSKQVLRCGTSIGANVKEALRGQSRADFRVKMNIALKEASETEYWLELLHESDYISDEQFQSIITDNIEIIKNFNFHSKELGNKQLSFFTMNYEL